jgi:hypothetical protein
VIGDYVANNLGPLGGQVRLPLLLTLLVCCAVGCVLAYTALGGMPMERHSSELVQSCYTDVNAMLQQAALEALDTAEPVSGFMDSYAPTASQALQGNLNNLADAAEPQLERDGDVPMAEQRWLRQSAAEWIHSAGDELRQLHPQPPLSLELDYSKGASVGGCFDTLCLSTRQVGAAVMKAKQSVGITLYEPFGGMCSGLEAMLANGMHVSRYLYSDTHQLCSTACSQVPRELLACSVPSFVPLLCFC